MPRIEVCKSADNQTLVRVNTPNGPMYLPQAGLRPLPPLEIRQEAAKSADFNPAAIASEREQFDRGSREMFGPQEAEPPKELEPSGNDILDSVFQDTPTLFAAELD